MSEEPDAEVADFDKLEDGNVNRYFLSKDKQSFAQNGSDKDAGPRRGSSQD